MNFFDGRNFRINKIFLSIMGQWPYRTITRKYVSLVALFVLVDTQILAKLCATMSSFYGINVAMNDMSPLIGDIMGLIKFVNSTIKTKKIRKLPNRMQIDYTLFTTDEETKIMETFADVGRKFTLMYLGPFCVTLLWILRLWKYTYCNS